MVIKSFKCDDTCKLFETGKSPRFGSIAKVATRKLAQLEAAATLEFLRSPPGNRLEALKGDRQGQYSIRVNDQWRICFRWTAAGPEDVEIVDCHWGSRAYEFQKMYASDSSGGGIAWGLSAPAGLTANALAKALRVPAPRINDIVRERRGITADTAERLARYFGGDAQSWLNLQTLYDLRVAEKANARKIDREVTPLASDAAWAAFENRTSAFARSGHTRAGFDFSRVGMWRSDIVSWVNSKVAPPAEVQQFRSVYFFPTQNWKDLVTAHRECPASGDIVSVQQQVLEPGTAASAMTAGEIEPRL